MVLVVREELPNETPQSINHSPNDQRSLAKECLTRLGGLNISIFDVHFLLFTLQIHMIYQNIPSITLTSFRKSGDFTFNLLYSWNADSVLEK